MIFLRLDCFVLGSVCLTAAYFQNVLTYINHILLLANKEVIKIQLK